MSDRRAPLSAVESLRNTRRSMGDGTLDGRSRIATPFDTRRLRRATSSVPGAAPSKGESLTLARASQSIPEGGAWVEFDVIVEPGPISVGENVAVEDLPLSEVPPGIVGYYDLHYSGEWVDSFGGDWWGGGWVRVYVNDRLVQEFYDTKGPGGNIVVALGWLTRDDVVKVWVQHEDGP